MIKVGDLVRYAGPLDTFVGRSGGKVVSTKYHGNGENTIEVMWPGLRASHWHCPSSLIITNQVQDMPLAGSAQCGSDQPKDDGVRKPSHYQVFDGVESIEIIARSMTISEFRGFCMGNVLKYRLRAGKKSELATMEKDLNKAAFYQELFDLHKGKCHDSE